MVRLQINVENTAHDTAAGAPGKPARQLNPHSARPEQEQIWAARSVDFGQVAHLQVTPPRRDTHETHSRSRRQGSSFLPVGSQPSKHERLGLKRFGLHAPPVYRRAVYRRAVYHPAAHCPATLPRTVLPRSQEASQGACLLRGIARRTIDDGQRSHDVSSKGAK